MKWAVPMPTTEPRAGHAHVRLGVKRADGGRLEFDGQLPEELAMQIQLWVCSRGQQPPKEQA